LLIDRVTREAATELVEHAARSHAFAGVQHHPDGLLIPSARSITQKKGRLAGAGKFGRRAKAAEVRVILALEERSGVGQQIRRQGQIARLARRVNFQPPVKIRRSFQNMIPARLPEAGDLPEHLHETGAAMHIFRRENKFRRRTVLTPA